MQPLQTTTNVATETIEFLPPKVGERAPMRQGLANLGELATRLTEDAQAKEDFTGDLSLMRFRYDRETNSSVPVIIMGKDLQNDRRFPMTRNAQQQLCNSLNIPWKYFQMLLEDHEGLANFTTNVLMEERSKPRLVRTLHGRCRAVLSENYRPLDNFDLAEAVIPTLMEVGEEHGLQLASCQVTESRMYIKAVFPKVEAEVKKGDVVQQGLVISNSEIGHGTLRVEPLVFRLVCLNGMVSRDRGMRRRHVGGSTAGDEGIEQFLSDETRDKEDEAIWSKVRDTVAGMASQEFLQELVDDMKRAAGVEIPRPQKAVEALANKHKHLTEADQEGILHQLLGGVGSEPTMWGLINAVTAHSKSVEDYDRATELETLGGDLLALPAKSWESIALAGAE